MEFIAYFLVTLVLVVVAELLRPKPDIENAKQAGLGDFNFPTVSEARPVPVVWGLVEIKAPNVICYGDLKVVAITEKIKTGMFSSKKVTVGYKYYIGMHIALCTGKADSMEAIFMDERELWAGNANADASYSINKPSFHRGQDAGGVVGTFSFKPGDPNAGTSNAYLLSKVSAQYPIHYGISSVIFEQVYIGNSPNIPKISFFVRRIPTAPSATYANIGGYANPSNIIYEILTDENWGAGLSTGVIDTASFITVAGALHTEGFAMSLIWDNRKSYADLVSEILRHIEGILYYDISTGLLKLKLLRKDYVVGNLPLFNEANILSLTDFAKPSYEETANELRLVYYDAVERKERTVVIHDTGNLQMQGTLISVEKKYAGICTQAIASKVAARDLAIMASPILKVSFYCDRSAFNLTPGDPFRFAWAEQGITEAVLRIVEIDFGLLTDGKIHVTAIEDISGGGTIVYSSEGSSGAVVANDSPVNIATYLQVEAPYPLRNFAEYVEGSAAEADMAIQLYLASKPSNYTVGYNFYEKSTTGIYSLHDNASVFCPSGTIYESPGLIKENLTASFTIDISSELDDWALVVSAREVSGLLYCDGEYMSYESAVTINGGTHLTFTNLRRGLLDTVPAVHSSIGTRIWSVSSASQLNLRVAATGSVITVAQPVATGGELDLASCTPRTITFASRGLKPYPPGNWKLEGAYYPSTFTGDLLVGWNHRNRQLNTGNLWYQTDADVGAAEAGTTYELKFYNTSGGALKRTVSGLTGITYTYLETDQLADNGGVTLPPGLRVTLTSSRDGYTCLQTHDWTMTRA
jgi:hypothetical protein